MKYSTILFDADNTVLDFDRSEEQALQQAFESCNLKYDNEILTVYRKMNIAQWQRYERGEISRNEVLINRFLFTVQNLQIRCSNVQALADNYEKFLHFGYFKVPHAEEVLQELLHLGCRLYIVSNGVLSIQNSRMKGSGLEKYFQKRFVSEEIGCPKPQVEFFLRCFAQIPDFCKSQTLIVGDSLTSDIRGGVNAGLDTCWFNPNGAKNNTDLLPTYQIDDLRKLLEIVLQNETRVN